MRLEVIGNIYKRKKEERERLREACLAMVFNALATFLKEAYFEEAYIFGSVIRPFQFGQLSDIDIAFKGLDKDKLFYATAFFSRELGRDVNIVPIEGVHFSEKIVREGIRWKKG